MNTVVVVTNAPRPLTCASVAHRDSIKGENVRRLQKWSTSLIAGAAISFSIGCSLNAGVPSTGNLQDEAAIKRVVSEMTQGFNSHDAEAATRMYTTDADFVSVRGEVAKGREEIRKGLAAILSTRARNASLDTRAITIRFIRPDVALVHVDNELRGLVNFEGQTLPAHRELSLRVFVKESGVWQVSAFQNTLTRPFEPSSMGKGAAAP
ncbi:SgcJ/EcaC family oxidoreductase [Caballeronia sp. S22]|uniref:SgcJ/EcaC family oxidoreductase n=1 Tax=Caballeronia sp. S22 TaxID=3137182 RepID=UPI003530BB3E